MTRSRLGSAAGWLLLVTSIACQAPHLVLTVEDPDDLAATASALALVLRSGAEITARCRRRNSR